MDRRLVGLACTVSDEADRQPHRLGPGDSAFVPRGTAHTFAGAPADGDAPTVRFLTLHTPAGFEQMHRDVAAAERAVGRALEAPDIIPIARHHDWVLAGPPLLPTGELAPAAQGLAGGPMRAGSPPAAAPQPAPDDS